MATLPDQMRDDPVFFPLLERQQFASAQAAADEHGEHRMVTELARRGRPRVFQQPSALFGRKPVAETDPKTSNALHAADACGQVWAQEAGVGGLVRHPAHRRQTEVDRGRGIWPLLEVYAVPKDDGAVEREPWLRAVPLDELTNRVIVGALAGIGV
jgi:hypothetical protein